MYEKYLNMNDEFGPDNCWTHPVVTETGHYMDSYEVWGELFYPIHNHPDKKRKKVIQQHCGNLDHRTNTYKPSACYNPRHLYLLLDTKAKELHLPSATFLSPYRKGKLKASEIREIMRIYREGTQYERNQKRLAQMFAVDQTLISSIISRQAYRDIVPYDDRHHPDDPFLSPDSIFLIRVLADYAGYKPERYYPDDPENKIVSAISWYVEIPYSVVHRVVSNYVFQYDDYVIETANPRRVIDTFARQIRNPTSKARWEEMREKFGLDSKIGLH